MSVYAPIVGPKGTRLTPRNAESRPIPPPVAPGKSRLIAIPGIGAGPRPVFRETGAGRNESGLRLHHRAQLFGGGRRRPISRCQGIAIMDAVQEELGLKLVPRKAAVDIIVIDHAELPTAN
jgi:hypothetical protein